MNTFQIIAIKTGNNENSTRNFLRTADSSVDINYLKNLETNKVYRFNNCYEFPDDDFSNISYKEERDVDLYSVKLSDNSTIPINICAVVGGNGSGKSALLELIYWINYNIACQLELLKKYEEKYLPNKLNLELLYTTGSEYILLKVLEGKSKFIKFNLGENPYKKQNWTHIDSSSTISVLKEHFYSIVINYSQYALNAQEVGDWVNPLFHKNDGYQTPIVLNPMRIDGNFDINRERELLSRRLQSNLLEPLNGKDVGDSIRNLANGKIAKSFKVEYNNDYFTTKNKNIPKENLVEIADRVKSDMGDKFDQNEEICLDVISRCYQERIEDNLVVIDGLDKAIETLFKFNLSLVDKYFKDASLKYITKKLLRMTYQYHIYNVFRKDGKICDIENFLDKIKTENSHTAFKVKGVIMHLKYYERIYKNSNIVGSLNINPIEIESFEVNIDNFSNLIQEIRCEKNAQTEINNYIMAFPPFFKVTILPEGSGAAIKDFSSGEKQRINSLSSIIYHLINLNSVEEKDGNIRYKYFNLILDEIELYYHPEWQRTYINDLLQYISKVSPSNLKNIEGINIIFATHSPFILSDIPKSKIICLKDGKECAALDGATFSANIHDLLSSEFFMNKGLMGEFAKQKINSLIDFLENKQENRNYEIDEWNQNKANKFISLIGEPLIRNSLRDLYNKVFIECDADSIQREIDRLQSIKKMRENESN